MNRPKKGRAKGLFFLAVPIICTAALLYPIALSGLSGDDIPNSMRSAVLHVNNWSRWDFIKLTITQWRTNEGRFFPISSIENVFMFDFIHSVAIYKILQLLVTILVLAIAAATLGKIVKDQRVFVLALFVLVSCIQTRNWYDPTLGFGLLLQSVQIKILLCISALSCFLEETGRRRFCYLAFSVSLWIMALLQYEVVVTLLPALVGLVIIRSENRFGKVIAFLTIGLPTAVYLYFVNRLRSGVSASSAYSIHIDLASVSITYLKQLSGAIPFSAAIWSRGASSILASLSDLPLYLLFLISATVCLALSLQSSLRDISNKSLVILLIIGANFILWPAITTALSLRWQSEVDWGLSYLSVSFAYTGVAFVAVAVMSILSKMCQGRTLLSVAITSSFLVFFTLSAVSNYTLLTDNALATQVSREQRNLYESAVKEGFMSDIPDKSVIIYAAYNENSWVNSYFTSWLGGPAEIAFVNTLEDAHQLCSTNAFLKKCPPKFLLEYNSIQNSRFVLSLIQLDDNHKVSNVKHRFFAQRVLPGDFESLCPDKIPLPDIDNIFSCPTS